MYYSILYIYVYIYTDYYIQYNIYIILYCIYIVHSSIVKVVRALEQLVQKGCGISVFGDSATIWFGHIFWGLNWKSLEVISDPNYSNIISSSLIVLIVISSSFLQSIALVFSSRDSQKGHLWLTPQLETDSYLFEELRLFSGWAYLNNCGTLHNSYLFFKDNTKYFVNLS